MSTVANLDQAVAAIRDAPRRSKRRLVALVGAPGSGKSTLADALAAKDPGFAVVPMDGFHLDNRILEKRGLLARKGAPETFDAAGFRHLLERFARGEDAIYPVFDRASEQAIAGAAELPDGCETIVVEGNYLLLDAAEWRPLHPLWDISLKLDEPRDVLEARLMKRWHGFGYDDAAARSKVHGNDLPNADLINERSVPADLVVRGLTL